LSSETMNTATEVTMKVQIVAALALISLISLMICDLVITYF
jgi:hypothetical protein